MWRRKGGPAGEDQTTIATWAPRERYPNGEPTQDGSVTLYKRIRGQFPRMAAHVAYWQKYARRKRCGTSQGAYSMFRRDSICLLMRRRYRRIRVVYLIGSPKPETDVDPPCGFRGEIAVLI